MRARSAVTLGVALLLGALVPAARAQAPVLPEGAVAQVGAVRTVTRADLDRWIDVVAASEDGPRASSGLMRTRHAPSRSGRDGRTATSSSRSDGTTSGLVVPDVCPTASIGPGSN